MSASLESLYADLKPLSLAPLWTAIHDLVPPQPKTHMRPAHWQYDRVRPLLLRAGQAITAAEAIRRVLILENPGAVGTACITDTLYAGLQLILPGEVAPAHRHTQSAFRFVLEGHGAFTTVSGERFDMEPGDLILTPNLEWHDHGHDGSEPVVWLDGLDIPLVRSLAAGFSENYPDRQQTLATRSGTNTAEWGSGLRPVHTDRGGCRRQVERFVYPFREWYVALKALAESREAPGPEGFALEFTNPVGGDSVLPTMSAFCHRLPRGFRTREQNRTDGTVFCVVEGAGTVTVAESRFDVTARDVFVVPSWAKYQIAAEESLVLFSYSDRATQERLGLWRQVFGEC